MRPIDQMSYARMATRKPGPKESRVASQQRDYFRVGDNSTETRELTLNRPG